MGSEEHQTRRRPILRAALVVVAHRVPPRAPVAGGMCRECSLTVASDGRGGCRLAVLDQPSSHWLSPTLKRTLKWA